MAKVNSQIRRAINLETNERLLLRYSVFFLGQTFACLSILNRSSLRLFFLLRGIKPWQGDVKYKGRRAGWYDLIVLVFAETLSSCHPPWTSTRLIDVCYDAEKQDCPYLLPGGILILEVFNTTKIARYLYKGNVFSLFFYPFSHFLHNS